MTAKFRRRAHRRRSPHTPLFLATSRLMEPHGKRERERRLRQIAKGSLKPTPEKPDNELPAEEVPGPGQAEARPVPAAKIVEVAAVTDR